MAEERKRSGPPEDSSSGGARQRFGPPKYPDASRRNMMKCIAAVLIVLGMIMTAVATPHAPKTWASIYEPHRVSSAELREDLRRRKAFWRTSDKQYLPYISVFPNLPHISAQSGTYSGTWHLVYEYQVLLCVFCISRRHLFYGQLLVRELSQRWVGIVSHLQ